MLLSGIWNLGSDLINIMNFINPLFLIGALVSSVPILLHLIRREPAHKIEFPTLMFLRRITKRTIRYQKLRHLLLLLLRILALLLIVLAFMRPYRSIGHASVRGGIVASAHIIVLDNSMSMNYQDRWSRARKAAADIVRKASLGDTFAVLEFSDSTEVRTPLTTSSAEALAQIENGVKLSDRLTRYAQALKIAERFALDSGAGKRIIHLISDFQKNGWAAEEQEYRLGTGIYLQYVDVGSNDFSNLAIREARVIETELSATGGIGIKASVMNFGNHDRRDVPVKLLVDNRATGEKKISVAKESSEGIEFQVPSLFSGPHSAMLEIDDPYLVRDNRFCMTIEARSKTPVLAVDNPDARGRRAPSFFLAKALNVDLLSSYKLTVVSPQNLVVSGGLLIWNDAPAGLAMQKKLQDFVKAGGGLAVVLGNSTQASDFNRSFGSWLPVRMAESPAESRTRSRPAENYLSMTDVRSDHPIFQPFGKPHSGIFSNARFYNHAQLSVGAGVEVPARFDNGDPALMCITVGKGRVVLFPSSADDSSNDLPLKAVYAPFWQQILHYLEGFREQRHWVDVGDMVAPKKLLVEAAFRQAKGNLDPGDAIAIIDPEKQRLAGTSESEGVVLDRAGFYEIRTMNLSATVAVNTVPRESDLTHGNAEEMIAGWLSSKPAVISQEERLTPDEQDKRQRFWVFLLAAAVLFLAAESLLSNKRRTGEV
jgi:hypothetical protein